MLIIEPDRPVSKRKTVHVVRNELGEETKFFSDWQEIADYMLRTQQKVAKVRLHTMELTIEAAFKEHETPLKDGESPKPPPGI